MKKRLRKTGEVVDVIDWHNYCEKDRDKDDWVSYIDSKGVEHHVERGLNMYWDFENVAPPELIPKGAVIAKKQIDWEQVRINASIAALKGFSSNPHNQMVDAPIQKLSEWAVKAADALIAELKKGGKDETK